MVISNEGVSRSNKQERSETELTVLDQKEVVNVVLDEVVVLDKTTGRTVLVQVLDFDFFSITDREDTFTFMNISTDFTEIDNVSFLLEFLVLGAQEFSKEFFTLFLISQNPSLGEVLVETEALGSISISFSIRDQSITGTILSVQVFMASNVIGGLGKARVLLSDLSAEEEKVENEPDISVQRSFIESFLIFSPSGGNVFTDLGDNLRHELVATSKVGHEVGLFSKDDFRVFDKVSSMFITIVKIRSKAHDFGVVFSTRDDTIFDDFKDIELGEEVVGFSRIVKVVSSVSRSEVGIEDSEIGTLAIVLAEGQESNSEKVESKDAQGNSFD